MRRCRLSTSFLQEELYTRYCESSISLEGDSSKDRVKLCHLSTSFQEGPHQKLLFDLKDKNYKKAKMKGARLDERYRE